MPSGTTTGIWCSFSRGVEAWSVNTLTDERRRVVERVSDRYQIDDPSARVGCIEEYYRIYGQTYGQ